MKIIITIDDERPVFPTPRKDDFPFQWPVLYPDPHVPAMCRQCIGKVCGNAACPARPVVTCTA